MAEAEETATPGSPTLRELVVKVVSACTDRKGLSFYALKMALASEGYDFKLYILKRTVLNLVRRGELIQNQRGLNGRLKAPKPEKGGKKKAAEEKGAKAKKCSEPKEPKEKKEKKPKKPREPKNAVVVTLE